MSQPESQLRLDLSRRIHDRLYDWARDSANLYEMAELGSRATVEDIMTSVISFAVAGIVSTEMNEDAMFETMKAMIDRRRRRAESNEL